MPILTVIAGPNGSGKSTLTRSSEFEGRDRLLDPDAIARELNPLNPSMAAVAAGREVLTRTAEYLHLGVSFAIETTLSSRGRLELIRRAKSHGYAVHLLYIAVDSAERSISRVRNRAAQGGHFIPEADVRRRYARSTANAIEALRLVDAAKFYDNSEDRARLFLIMNEGVVIWRAERFPEWVRM